MDLRKILFIDVETVSQTAELCNLSDEMQEHWIRKASRIYPGPNADKELTPEESYSGRAAIFAEFGKIVCISVGVLQNHEHGEVGIRLKSYTGHDESQLLQEFSTLLNEHYPDAGKSFLCGHNIKEFDIPYICRRMIVNQIPLPGIINISGKKPWEIKHLLDTMEMWRFGDIKNFTSLDLLSSILGIPSPKDDIDGSMVGKVYWEDKDLDRIALYCEKDVVTVANVFLKLNHLALIENDKIVIA
jgi:3'-5' exonuclease